MRPHERDKPAPHRCRVRRFWPDAARPVAIGGESTIDVSRPVNIYRLYQPLRDNPALFGQVRVGEYGADVTWTDWVDMSADMLWHLAAEQRTAPTLALQTGH